MSACSTPHAPRPESKSSRKPRVGPGTTVTATSCAAVRPPGSLAVNISVVVPAATPEIDIVRPDTEARATRGFEDAAWKLSAPPSGSSKNEDTATETVSPEARLTAGIEPVATGARFGRTVTPVLCVAASPPGSRAVSVRIALPEDTAVTVTTVPETATRAAAASVLAS